MTKNTFLSIKHRKLSEEWNYKKNNGLTPDNVFESSKKRVWWVCRKCKHEWMGIIQIRSMGKRKCPKCSSLGSLYPKLLKEWDYKRNKNINPYVINPNSHKKVWWICKKNKKHRWYSSPNSRINMQATEKKNNKKNRGCPYCLNKKVSIDNCLFTKDIELSKEWNFEKNHGLTPKDFVSKSYKKVWWKCKYCGNEWQSRIRQRFNGSGCPKCCKILLKNGATCDSLVEAYFYLKFKKEKIKFKHNGFYGEKMKSKRYDFYFPKTNTYVEVTGYNEKCFIYKKYIKKIKTKQRFVKNYLKANFKFIRHILSLKEYRYVRNHICRDKIINKRKVNS